MNDRNEIYRYIPMLSMKVAQYFYVLHYLYRILFRSDRKFVYNSKVYEYFSHPYNTTWRNERSVEIPIVLDVMKNYEPERVLEVGNVLCHYIKSRHTVVDKFENEKNVVMQDILQFQSPVKYDLIVCISTLEHVGFDETPREENKHRLAVKSMRTLLSPNGKLIVTVPWAYNPFLDFDLLSGNLGFSRVGILKRVGSDAWCEAGWEDIQNVRYGSPYRAANALVVASVDANSWTYDPG